MKLYTMLTAIALIACSCNISKTGCYTGTVTPTNNNEFEVAMSSPQILSNEQLHTLPVPELSVQEAAPIELNEVYSYSQVLMPVAEEEATPEEQLLLAFAPQLTSAEDDAAPLTITALMAENLRYAATTMEGRFTKRILNKSANRIERMSFETKHRVTFMDKIRVKLSEKFFAAYAPAQGASNVLAIVSLITGILSFAWYASFVLGVAAIVTGAIALAGGASRRGMAIAGIVLGAIAIALWSGLIGGGAL